MDWLITAFGLWNLWTAFLAWWTPFWEQLLGFLES